MPAVAPDQFLLHYLMCDLPLGYPMKTPVAKLLMPENSSVARRELLHQQAQFLELARPFLETHPWVAYLAAVKHEAVLVAIPTFAPQLVDVVDKFFFAELQEKSRELRAAARAAIDDATAEACERLVLLQSEAEPIENALKSVEGAVQAGLTAVEPLPPPPPEPPTGRKSLPYFVGAGVGCVAAGAIIPPYDGGMAWSLVGLVLTGILAMRTLGKERKVVQAKSAEYKAYLLLEHYHVLCKKSVSLVLAMPFEVRKEALVNLPPCLEALRLLGPEREALEAHYIRPYVS